MMKLYIPHKIRYVENNLPVQETPLNFPSKALSLSKRCFDIFFSISILVLLSPILIAVAAAIKLTSNSPVIFRQERIGLSGRIFTIYKFRSKVHQASSWRFGEFLRKASVDELPQLWNVIKGDMSLVGPRPHVLEQVVIYQTWQYKRLTVKPGITGLRQIETLKKDIEFNELIELDLEYIENYSIWLDFKILARTIYGFILNIPIIRKKFL